MNNLIIIGNGGHSKVVQDIVKAQNKYSIYAVLDDAIEDTVINNDIIFSNIDFLNQLDKENFFYVIAIGNNQIRKKIVKKIDVSNERYATVIHPSAIISESSKISYGTLVMPKVVINANTLIGNHCIINTNATIEHDNKLESFVHVSPGTILSGRVKIGSETHLGSGTVVIPNINIGSESIIGAGTVITKDIPNNVTAVGVPAKIIKE